MSATIQQLQALKEAAKRANNGSGQVVEFDAKVKVTVNPGSSGNSLLASTIVLEDLGIRLSGFRMNVKDDRLIPFFPGQNTDEDGNRYVDVSVDTERAPFDLVVLANEKERTDPRTGRTYRAMTNVRAVEVNGNKLARTIAGGFFDALESGALSIQREEISDLSESLIAVEA